MEGGGGRENEMDKTKERYAVDENGKKTAVVIPVRESQWLRKICTI